MTDIWESASWVLVRGFFSAEFLQPIISGVITPTVSLTANWGDPAPGLRAYVMWNDPDLGCISKGELQAAFPGLVVRAAVIPAGTGSFPVTAGSPDPPGTIVCP